MDYAQGIAEKAKGGIDENPEGLSSVTGTENKPNDLVSSLMDWASDITTISSAGESSNPKGLTAYNPEVIKIIQTEPEIERITWDTWFNTSFLSLDTLYMIYGWPYFAVDSFFNSWKLYYDHTEEKSHSLTFTEAVNIALASIT
jgi:hypothetical protein